LVERFQTIVQHHTMPFKLLKSTTVRGGLRRRSRVYLAILLPLTIVATLLDPIPLMAIGRSMALGVVGGVILAPGLPLLAVPAVLLMVFGWRAITRASVVSDAWISDLLPMLITLTTCLLVAVVIDGYLRRRAALGNRFARTLLGEVET
jgi:hypothetical protein